MELELMPGREYTLPTEKICYSVIPVFDSKLCSELYLNSARSNYCGMMSS